MPRHEGYVGFRLVESSLLPRELPSDRILAWANAYEIQRIYGGPEEGGWYYNRAFPLACVYVGEVDCEVGTWIPFVSTQEARDALAFLSNFYADIEEGDIYSVQAGADLHVILENQRAMDSGPEWFE
jgi:hypothetical protein